MPEQRETAKVDSDKVEMRVDSPPPDGVVATGARDWWNRPIRVDGRGALACAAKALGNIAIGNVPGAAWEAVDGALKCKATKEPEELAGQLITRAVWAAVVELIGSLRSALDHRDGDALLKLAGDVSGDVLSFQTRIDSSFFDNPQGRIDLAPIQQAVAAFLLAAGMAQATATNVAARLPSYVSLALHQEWARQPGTYDALMKKIETPFSKADEKERGWMAYRAALMRLPDEPVMGEPITLGQIFVPLRCWRWETIEDKSKKGSKSPFDQPPRQRRRTVEMVQESIRTWLETSDSQDAVRAISGGPGAGKSSLSKMIAADCAKRGEKVILVPLKRIDARRSIEDSLKDFCGGEYHLAEDAFRDENVTLILDGLDELSLRGKSAAEEAKDFVEDVIKWTENRHRSANRVRVLFTGRTVVVEALGELKKAKAVRELIPLLVADKNDVSEDQRRAGNILVRESFHDPDGLLQSDDRKIWWQGYAKAVADAPDPAPILGRKDLHDLTQEPLLNFLIAQGDQQAADLAGDGSRAQLYDGLLRSVYQRKWGRDQHTIGEATHPVLKDLEEFEFLHLLEEFAVPVWHGGGGTATEDSLEKRCKAAEVTHLLEKLRGGLEKGVPQLLAAFYFRPAGHVGDNTYEFTHKSFWEYLIARRIARLATDIAEERALNQRRPGKGWRVDQALTQWGELLGPARMERNLFQFVHEEFARRAALNAPEDDHPGSDHLHAPAVQKEFALLFQQVVNHGMPGQGTWSSQSSIEIAAWCRHAEESLAVAHHAAAVITRERSDVVLATPHRLGHWLASVRGQRTGQFLPGLAALGWWAFSGPDATEVVIIGQDLQGVDLEGVDLTGAEVQLANLSGANLWGASFEHGNLESATLRGADLSSACLLGANLLGAKLQGANLPGADLRVAKLQGADLRGAKLQGADLEDAKLQGADLEGAILPGAILRRANLPDAKLEGADLRKATLVGADLRRADLRGAILQGTKGMDKAHWTNAIINSKTINPPSISEWERIPAPDIGPDCFRLKSRSTD